MNKARNAGVEGGWVDFVGTGIQFGCQVLFWKEETTVGKVDNTGQGDGDISDSLALIESGNAVLKGKVRRDLFPVPDVLKNATGTLTFYVDKAIPGGGQADIKRTATFRAAEVQSAYSEKDETSWDITIVAERVSAFTYSGFANNSTITAASARTAGNKYLYQGRQKLYDPNGLTDSSVQVFNVWGMSADTDAQEVTSIGTLLGAYTTPPQTSEKQHTAIGQRLSSGVMRITLRWSPRSTLDEELFPDISSTRSPSHPFTDSNAVILNSTLSTANLTNALYNGSGNTDYLSDIIVRPRTDGKKKAIFKYVNPGVLVTFNARSGSRLVAARVSGGNPQLHVLQLFQYSSTRAAIILSQVNDLTAEINDFTVYRQVRGTTVPKSNPDTIGGVTLPLIGQTNNASFLGYAAGNVQYAGPRGKVNIGLSAGGTVTFVMFMSYAFHASTQGIITGVPQQVFGRKLVKQFSSGTLTAIIAALASGDGVWVDAADLAYPNVTLPSQASFSAFTTWSAP